MKKRAITLLAAIVCLTSAMRLAGQSFNAGETTKLRAFLRMKSGVEGKLNYEQLGIADTNAINWATVTGLTWGADGRLQAMLWNEKQLGGELDLSGFTSLRTLHCERNSLLFLHLTGDTSLVYVDCFNNMFKSLDISTNVNLDHFCCRYNQLDTLDVSHNPKLTFLCLSGNQFRRFDTSKNPLLMDFYAAACQLEEIDFSHNPMLRISSVRGNKLKRIDLSGHEQLTQFYCHDNELTELNVKGCKALTFLSVYGNKLTTLDVSTCPALERLPLYDNSIAELDVSACPKIAFISTMNNGMHTLKLPKSPLDRLSIMCESNRFTFSTLPDVKYLNPYAPQAKISLSAPVDKVDLSAEYKVRGAVSVFTWRNGTDTVTPTIAREGLFSFPADLVGRTLTCTVKNAAYPKLTLTYEVALSSPTANVTVADLRPTVRTESGRLVITTARPLVAGVYAITGVLVARRNLGIGESHFVLPRGIYIVSFSDGTARKVVVE